jgi:hypothetical protein
LNFVAVTGFGACVEERAGERIYEVRLNLIADSAPSVGKISKAEAPQRRARAVQNGHFES